MEKTEHDKERVRPKFNARRGSDGVERKRSSEIGDSRDEIGDSRDEILF
jgi:hypothetical protein